MLKNMMSEVASQFKNPSTSVFQEKGLVEFTQVRCFLLEIGILVAPSVGIGLVVPVFKALI